MTAQVENRASTYIKNWHRDRDKDPRNTESHLNEDGTQLFDSGVWYDSNGRLFFATYQPLTVADLAHYTVIYPQDRRFKPESPRSILKDKREKIWNRPKTLESGIKMIKNHILEGTRGKEADQVKEVVDIVKSLSQMHSKFVRQFFYIDFELVREQAEAAFLRKGLHPERLKVQAKISMVQRALKVSRGVDSRGRDNPMIMRQILKAIKGDIARRNSSLAHIYEKYSGALTAMLAARILCRETCSSVTEQLADDGPILKTILFTKEDIKERELQIQVSVIDSIIETLVGQIEQGAFIRPYKSAGAAAIHDLTVARIQLGKVKRLYEEGKSGEAVSLWRSIKDSTEEYLQYARDNQLKKTLDDYEDIEKADANHYSWEIDEDILQQRLNSYSSESPVAA